MYISRSGEPGNEASRQIASFPGRLQLTGKFSPMLSGIVGVGGCPAVVAQWLGPIRGDRYVRRREVEEELYVRTRT